MNNTKFYWRSYTRDALATVLLEGDSLPNDSEMCSDRLPSFNGNCASIGYAALESSERNNLPSLLVLQESTLADTFSWLRTFAPPTSPLSQYARVITNIDWNRFTFASGPRRSHRHQSASRWAGIVLGEILAQGDGDADLISLPLSRVAGCFSNAIARTSLIYGEDNASVTCVDRLRKLETDRRFVRRAVSIEDLLPVWAIANELPDKFISPPEVAPVVVDALFNFSAKKSEITSTAQVPLLVDFPGLFSDSVEERVLSFQKLIAHTLTLQDSDTRVTATVAAGAFLVGRGTSHSFLLGRVRRKYPAAYIWFGLMAALAGASVWDTNWARISRGIERTLRARFDWAEVPTTDICWAEYAWMSSVFDGVEVFKSIPKAYPRVLSVEVIPGASCQFRFVSEVKEVERELARVPEKSARELELEAALVQFVSLAGKVHHYVEGMASTSQGQQLDLILEKDKPKGNRSKRSKKAAP